MVWNTKIITTELDKTGMFYHGNVPSFLSSAISSALFTCNN